MMDHRTTLEILKSAAEGVVTITVTCSSDAVQPKQTLTSPLTNPVLATADMSEILILLIVLCCFKLVCHCTEMWKYEAIQVP